MVQSSNMSDVKITVDEVPVHGQDEAALDVSALALRKNASERSRSLTARARACISLTADLPLHIHIYIYLYILYTKERDLRSRARAIDEIIIRELLLDGGLKTINRPWFVTSSSTQCPIYII